MKAKRTQEPGPPDPALDRYRRGVARASENNVEVGFLWTRVQVWWLRAGPFWARRWVDPVETPEWFLEFDETPDWKTLPFEDRVPTPLQIPATLAALDRGIVQMNGHAYHLRWLGPDEAESTRHPLTTGRCVPADGWKWTS